ncbi:LYR motif-containing protein 2-like isoform X2 [Mya arenaria]|uniref:LYR motif-containing protein 2-like isoform X2 n=1 Tax=Mya arenaria TaxID=6604 RepID=UPI0022E97729|nr:LYR motif-containing protein 2-like isoform X2 [Mya arenaria]
MTGGKPVLTLKQFIVRGEVLKLYRDILRTAKQIPDDFYRNEMRQWARDDFKSNKHLDDDTIIKMNIQRGRKSLRELQQSLDLAQ